MNGPTGTAGIGANGILVDVSDTWNDSLGCVTGALSPATGQIMVGQTIAFRMATPGSHGWTNDIEQQNAAVDTWPTLSCMSFAAQGSTCMLGVNHGGITYTYATTHNTVCPDMGSVTVQ
jgi:hypothetical protein